MSYENIPKNISQKAILTRAGRPDYYKLEADGFPTPTLDERGSVLENTDTGNRYRWTGTAWVQEAVRGAEFVVAKDHTLEIAKGNVPGHSGFAVVMSIPAASTMAFEDVWGGGGNMVLPTAAESWEIVSSSANDSAAGTGARTVLISTLAADYSIQAPQVVTLNGTTPVAIPGTHFRPHHMQAASAALVVTAGSSQSNAGTLTVRVSGGGNTRTVILPGISKSQDGHRTVPLGYTAIAMQLIVTWGKNANGDVYDSILPAYADAPRISSGALPLYDNNLIVDYKVKPRVNETTDLVYKAKASSGGSTVVLIQEWILIDNAYIGIY